MFKNKFNIKVSPKNPIFQSHLISFSSVHFDYHLTIHLNTKMIAAEAKSCYAKRSAAYEVYAERSNTAPALHST